jgi:hypothetical protein
MMVFSLAPLYAAEEYSSNTKSLTGTMESRDMYFPGTEKLALDEMRMILNRLVQAIENTPEIQWEYKTVKVRYIKEKYIKAEYQIKKRRILKGDLSILNELGKDGWELCGVNNINYYFKREIRE